MLATQNVLHSDPYTTLRQAPTPELTLDGQGAESIKHISAIVPRTDGRRTILQKPALSVSDMQESESEKQQASTISKEDQLMMSNEKDSNSMRVSDSDFTKSVRWKLNDSPG